MDGPSLPPFGSSQRPRPQGSARPLPLKTLGIIEIPNGTNSDFDHVAFDSKTRRLFIAHTGRDRIEAV